MKKKIVKGALLLATIIVLVSNMTVTCFAAWGMPANANLLIDGKLVALNGYSVEGYDYYPLKDIAYILRNSDKSFNIKQENSTVSLIKNEPYPDDHTLFNGGAVLEGNAAFTTQNFYIDEIKYTYTVSKINEEIFMRLVDAAQLFDICMVYNHTKDQIVLDTTKNYITNFNEIAKEGFFAALHGAVVGNIEGDTFYSSLNADKPAAIASTTKLMTYLLVMEAVEADKISLDDNVKVTEEAARLSRTEDYVLEDLTIGDKMPLEELLDVMLVVSSNEAAAMLGEHVADTEEKFVELMNKRAEELGLNSAKFYNAHGLPIYTSDVLSSKLQNKMSAQDLLELSRYVIKKYPQIIEITNKPTVEVTSLGGFEYTGNTTNRLLFQIKGVDGLKTGTTNRAGACQVATMLTESSNPNSDRLIAVVLGAEDNLERYWKTGLLLQYAKEVTCGRKADAAYISIPKNDAPVSDKIEILFTDAMDAGSISAAINGKAVNNIKLSEDGKFLTASYSGLDYKAANTLSISGKAAELNTEMNKVVYKFTTVEKSSSNSQTVAKPIDALKDISSDQWYYDAAKFVVEKGLFTGVSDTEFSPNQNMTRAMFVTVLGRMAEQQGAVEYVAWTNEVVSGYDVDTFGDDDKVTREQMAVILLEFAKQYNIQLNENTAKSFADSHKISSWASEAINELVSAGILNGYEDGSLQPQEHATRAEVASALQRFMKAAK